jgi:hypothetical protein
MVGSPSNRSSFASPYLSALRIGAAAQRPGGAGGARREAWKAENGYAGDESCAPGQRDEARNVEMWQGWAEERTPTPPAVRTVSSATCAAPRTHVAASLLVRDVYPHCIAQTTQNPLLRCLSVHLHGMIAHGCCARICCRPIRAGSAFRGREAGCWSARTRVWGACASGGIGLHR